MLHTIWRNDGGQDVAKYAVMLGVISGDRGGYHPPGGRARSNLFANADGAIG
jgi:hypothetical protein